MREAGHLELRGGLNSKSCSGHSRGAYAGEGIIGASRRIGRNVAMNPHVCGRRLHIPSSAKEADVDIGDIKAMASAQVDCTVSGSFFATGVHT